MGNKQLFEKQSNSYKPIYPLVRLEDIIETISDKSIQWILNNYNHIYVEYSESKAVTRNKVPQLLRRTGLWISYNTSKEVITEYYNGDNKDVLNYNLWTNDDNWERFDKIKHLDGSITYQHLSESLRQLIGQGNNITNFPDDEDLEVKDGLLKLKDRDFEPNNFSGLGRVILRKNIRAVDGQPKNVLTQDMINKSNTIYEIRYDFDLNGAEITIPEDCILDFQGGSLNNGVLKGNYTKVIGNPIFVDSELTSFWKGEGFTSWFVGDDDISLANVLKFDICYIDKNLYIDNSYAGELVSLKSFTLKGMNGSIIRTNMGNKYLIRAIFEDSYNDIVVNISNINIEDLNYKDTYTEEMRKASHIGILLPPNGTKYINIDNVNSKTRGVCIGVTIDSIYDKEGETYSGKCFITLTNCNMISNDFCFEAYRPGNTQSINISNCKLRSTHKFRPEISVGTYAVSNEERTGYMYVSNCVLYRGAEIGVHNETANPNTFFIAKYDNVIFKQYRSVIPSDSAHNTKSYCTNCTMINDGSYEFPTNLVHGGNHIEFVNCLFDVKQNIRYFATWCKSFVLNGCTFYNSVRFDIIGEFDSITINNCNFINTYFKIREYDSYKERELVFKNNKYIGNSFIISDSNEKMYDNVAVNNNIFYNSQENDIFVGTNGVYKSYADALKSSKSFIFNIFYNRQIKVLAKPKQTGIRVYCQLKGYIGVILVDITIGLFYDPNGDLNYNIIYNSGGQYESWIDITQDDDYVYFSINDTANTDVLTFTLFSNNIVSKVVETKNNELIKIIPEYRNRFYYNQYSRDFDKIGAISDIKKVAMTTGDRGCSVFAQDLNKPIWWTGTKWVDATGADV